MASIERLKRNCKCANTFAMYKSAVYRFLEFTYRFKRNGVHVSAAQLQKYTVLADQYIEEANRDRNYTLDIKDFSNYNSENLSPKTCQSYVTAIKEFLLSNDVDITESQSRKISKSIKEGGAITREDILTRESIADILSYANLDMQAVIVLMASSGMRIGEVCNLRFDDIDITGDVGVFYIRKPKNKKPRYTFCNKEALRFLNHWIAGLPKYHEQRKNQRSRFLTIDDDRSNFVFPFGVSTAEKKMKLILMKAGKWKIDPESGKATTRLHLLRKFFYTQMDAASVPSKPLDAMVGHRQPLDSIYNKIPLESLKAAYLKGEPYLRIFDASSIEVVKVQEELRSTKTEIMDNRMDNTELKQNNIELKMEMAEILEKQNRLEQEMETMRGLLRDKMAVDMREIIKAEG